jgi:Zinc-finger double-stranded RNA-binding
MNSCLVAGCEYEGENRQALRQHTWSVHEQGAVATACGDCHLQCTVYQLTQHKRICAAQPKLFCGVCDKTLKNRRSLNKHKRSKAHAAALIENKAQPVIQIVNMEQVRQTIAQPN